MDEIKSRRKLKEEKQHEMEQKWRSDRHRKTPGQKIKRMTIGGLTAFVLILIFYTVILYGGQLIVDKNDFELAEISTIETSDGEVIWKLYEQYRIPVSLADVPEHVQEAFIAIEDRRFYSHGGVDFKSIMRAIYRDIIARSKVEGASTITQQLAKNLFLSNDKTWLRKTREVMVALYLERELTKDEILEYYLNTIYFGQGMYGIEAAANKYFSKKTEELTVTEAALLAGLVKAPNGYSPIDHPDKALSRRNVVLQTMYELELINESTYNEAQQQEIKLNLASKRETDPAIDSFVDLVIKEANDVHGLSMEELQRGGYRIVTTLDQSVQHIAYNQFQQGEYFPGNSEGVEGAFIMMEQSTGKIVAALGGRNYKIGDLNRINVKRQPGSTMKPLAVYGPAMMKEDFEPFTLIPDQKEAVKEYPVNNADHQYAGEVSIYEALIKSKNAPAVWLLNEIGVNYAKDYLKKMEIDIPDKELPLALGGLKEGVTPLDLVRSYRVFTSNGEMIETYVIEKIYNRDDELIFEAEPESTDVFSPQVAWNMTEMLLSAVENGTGSAGDYPQALAGKTGSTEHPHVEGMYKDAWFVGYTPEYVTALWMGYDRSDKDHYLTAGSEYPTRLTKRILTNVNYERNLAATFNKPENVKSLPKPIELPKINDLQSEIVFGGFPLFKRKLTWTHSADERVVYHIYKVKGEKDERVGEVKNGSEFTFDGVSFFGNEKFYVIPFDPLTNRSGERSNMVET